jgi:tagatose-6-phosphate ketose/aldose isomerase
MMNYLGMSQGELEKSGGYWTAREISQQPAVWTDVQRVMARDSAALQAFLDPLLARRELRIVLTGAGSSSFVGECLAPALARRLGLRVDAVATTDLVGCPESWLAPAAPVLLVSFARSGNSPESMAALTLAEKALPECHHLIVTCNREGALYSSGQNLRNAHVVLLPDETNDRGFAMTSSFTGMLLAAALAFDVLPRDAPAAFARWAGHLLAGFPLAASLARSGFERVVYLGSKEFKGLAREAALKMLELSDGKVVALAETPLGFRHGPKTIINAKTLVVMFLCNDPYTRRYEIDALRELRADGVAARVMALTAQDPQRDEQHADEILVPGAAAASDLGLCFPYAAFAQTFALLQSLALGLRPDTPNARGVVNRVVQGVSIYPWTQGQ